MPTPSTLPEQGRNRPEAAEQAGARFTSPGLGFVPDTHTTQGPRPTSLVPIASTLMPPRLHGRGQLCLYFLWRVG